MITVKKLKILLKDLPDDAICNAYEGERVGISIQYGNKIELLDIWWIDATDSSEEDTYTQGFKNLKEQNENS